MLTSLLGVQDLKLNYFSIFMNGHIQQVWSVKRNAAIKE